MFHTVRPNRKLNRGHQENNFMIYSFCANDIFGHKKTSYLSLVLAQKIHSNINAEDNMNITSYFKFR